ncbi:MAG TPA: hypothetical protein VIV15_01000 [Anaerolineales bacterium]
MIRLATSLALVLVITLLAGRASSGPYDYPPAPPPPPASSQPTSPALNAAVAQAKVAATHAGYAVDGTGVSAVREHLGHALVCIEGAKGKNVNPAWANPCQGMGNGVLVDLERANAGAALIDKTKEADSSTVAAIKSSDLAQMKAAAKQVSTLMQQVAQGR